MLLGGTRIGPYEVVAQLGEGGMGVVYRALDTRLGREVALKVIGDRKLDDAGSIARFQQEARLAGALDHPNVLAVHDVGEHEGKPFLITELLEGESLGQRLASGPLAQHEALGIARQVALGLAAAHDKGILHRDLKPHNLFLTRDGRVKILDFGVAKIVSRRVECTISKGEPSARTATGGVIGTPAYMSPEQVRGQQLDGRSDLFSLGCVLYESLAGHRPFEGTTALEIGVAILNDAPPPLPLSVQKTVARLVLHCLEKRPEDRFQSAHELAIDLGALPDQVPLANAATELSGVQVPAVERTGDVSASAHPARRIRTVSWITAGLVVLAIAAAIAYRTGLRLRETVDRAAALPSIAVLPFSDLSPAKDQEYFSDGIAEELLNALAHVEGLRVVGRTSSFSFKGKTDDLRAIGQKLGVAHVLEGSVRKSGARVRVTAQLVGVRDGFHVWSQSYDRDLIDIFAVQDDIARAVVDALRIHLVSDKAPSTSGQRTVNPEVYTQYLLGRQLGSRDTVDVGQRAIRAFEKALTIEPDYAPAWAELALALVGAADSASTAAVRDGYQRRAVAAAERAVSLDPSLAAAYTSRAVMRHLFSWDWSGALSDIERALAINPGDARAHKIAGRLAGTFGRLPQAIAALQKATELDPLNPGAWGSLFALAMANGQKDLARVALERQLEIAPEGSFPILAHGEFLLSEGKPEDARNVFDSIRDPLYRLYGLALAYHQLGRAAESQQALSALISGFEHVAAYQIALVYLSRRETDPAFVWLERAYLQRDSGLQTLKRGPFRQVRDDPRYVAMLKKLNLPLG